MFRPFYSFIGYRYSQVRRRNHFISFISLTSMLGIALGVMTLITVLSVMNGFKSEMLDKMLSATPQVTIQAEYGITDWQQLITRVDNVKQVTGITPFILGQGMISSDNNVTGLQVFGIEPKLINTVIPLENNMVIGNIRDLKQGEFGILLGSTLAYRLGVGLGDKITIIIPQVSVSPAGIQPRLKRFTVIGLYSINYIYDTRQVFINLDDAAKLFKTGNKITGLQLSVQEPLQAPMVANKIRNLLTNHYYITDWTKSEGGLLEAVQMEKTVMFVILLMLIAIAAFNLVSSLVMLVTDKRADIAILRTMGASKKNILGIFMIQGSIIGLTGTLLGLILGLLLAYNVTNLIEWLQNTFDITLMPQDIYFINYLPSEVHRSDVIAVCVLALIMSIIATIFPAWQASKINPAEALRYE